MSRFNTKSPSTATTNLAGGKAFKMTPKNELIHAVLSSFLEDKFYENGSDRLARIKSLVATIVTDGGAQFIAKLACYARLVFNLRSVSHVLVGELSKLHRGDTLVRNTIVALAVRPDDLTEILSYVGTPIPKQVKRGIRRALLKFNRYQLAKYRGVGKGWSMVDLFNMVRPNPAFATAEQRAAWADLMKGDLKSFDTWETEISNTTDKKASWEKLVMENKLGYMALIRNLNNLIEVGVSDEVTAKAIEKLTSTAEVRKSKLLPFRFMTAYKNVSGNGKLLTAISVAMDIAVGNTPALGGNTLIAIDTSGSMSGDPIEKASIFGATLIKANPNASVLLYSDKTAPFDADTRLPVINIAEKIVRDSLGGGTNTGLVFDWALGKKLMFDRFIIISDNESWQEGSWGNASTQTFYEQYRKLMGLDPHVYAIDIQGYGTKDIAGNRTHHLCGWSDKLLSYIGAMEDGVSLNDTIEAYEIPEPTSVVEVGESEQE